MRKSKRMFVLVNQYSFWLPPEKNISPWVSDSIREAQWNTGLTGDKEISLAMLGYHTSNVAWFYNKPNFPEKQARIYHSAVTFPVYMRYNNTNIFTIQTNRFCLKIYQLLLGKLLSSCQRQFDISREYQGTELSPGKGGTKYGSTKLKNGFYEISEARTPGVKYHSPPTQHHDFFRNEPPLPK